MLVVGRSVVDWVALKSGVYGHLEASAGIGWEIDGRLVAGVAYSDFNGVNIVASIAVDDGKITRDFLWTIFDYPFNQCRVNRITCAIGEGNERSINLCERTGFKFEARLSKAHPTGDLLIYRLFRNECKWLSLKEKQNG